METAYSLPAGRAILERNFEPGITPEEVIHAILERLGSCILRGCEVNGHAVGSGVVALAGIEDGVRVFRIVRFGGVDCVSGFPVYLALRGHCVEVHTVHPGLPCLRIERDGGREFVDAFRDA